MELRQSIEPTYDHRKTGDRYSVTSRVNGCTIADGHPCRDPFVRHTIRIHWWDALKALFFEGKITVEVSVDGDEEIIHDVMELDGDYLVNNSTRRHEFERRFEQALAGFGDEEEDD